MSADRSKTYGKVFNIQRYSIHDGPGIRTTVFLKGCPLRCAWCANPESQRFETEVTYQIASCVGCQHCVAACPSGACRFENGHTVIDREWCVGCGACARGCAYHALKLVGERMSVAEVVEQALRDAPFYRKSGGGVTISGGEAFAQPAFTLALLETLGEEGIHTAVETSGFAPYGTLEKAKADLFLYDLKLIDPVLHKGYIGQDNRLILENLKRLLQDGRQIIVRMPLIPGINTDPALIRRTGEYLRSVHAKQVHLLPYHRLGVGKYGLLDREYGLDEVKPPEETQLKEIQKTLEDCGLTVGRS